MPTWRLLISPAPPKPIRNSHRMSGTPRTMSTYSVAPSRSGNSTGDRTPRASAMHEPPDHDQRRADEEDPQVEQEGAQDRSERLRERVAIEERLPHSVPAVELGDAPHDETDDGGRADTSQHEAAQSLTSVVLLAARQRHAARR